MNKYLNILKTNQLIRSYDIKYKKQDLLNLFKREVSKSCYIEELVSCEKSRLSLKLDIGSGKHLVFFCFLKNVTGAGWQDKPFYKRVQVSNVLTEFPDDLNIVKDKKYSVIFGYYNFDNNPIIVAWDSYRYTDHSTLRSCYVTTDSLILGYERKYYEGVVSSQKVWIFDGSNFKRFVQNYVSYVNDFYLEE